MIAKIAAAKRSVIDDLKRGIAGAVGLGANMKGS